MSKVIGDNYYYLLLKVIIIFSDYLFPAFDLMNCLAFQVLSQGSSPLAYLSDHIQRYVSCEKDREAEGCDVILNPPAKTEVANRRLKAARWPLVPRPHRHHI